MLSYLQALHKHMRSKIPMLIEPEFISYRSFITGGVGYSVPNIHKN